MNQKKLFIINQDSPPSTISALPTASIRVLAIASSGGHWIQLLRLRPALEGHDLHFVGTDPDWKLSVTPHPFHVVLDFHFNEPWRMLRAFLCLLRLFRRIRPHVVVSTGAAPGGLAMLIGRIFRARTIWVDSVANCKVLSRSGRLSRRVAKIAFTQWPELACPDGPYYRGNILP